ncbi:MAG: DUF2938 family protein, partial [bacterium]
MTTLELLTRAAVMGIAGSAFIDAWAFFVRRTFQVSSLDYRMLGRWLGNMPHGRFFHARISQAPAVPYEGPLGWAAHYGIGITFAVA